MYIAIYGDRYFVEGIEKYSKLNYPFNILGHNVNRKITYDFGVHIYNDGTIKYNNTIYEKLSDRNYSLILEKELTRWPLS